MRRTLINLSLSKTHTHTHTHCAFVSQQHPLQGAFALGEVRFRAYIYRNIVGFKVWRLPRKSWPCRAAHRDPRKPTTSWPCRAAHRVGEVAPGSAGRRRWRRVPRTGLQSETGAKGTVRSHLTNKRLAHTSMILNPATAPGSDATTAHQVRCHACLCLNSERRSSISSFGRTLDPWSPPKPRTLRHTAGKREDIQDAFE